jgi:DNA-binding transcriptional MerR regulator
MAKSADAFRTISEVAEIVQVPAHVLRFWESKFTQVKPVKRAGGRRYYRPEDIRLLSGIRLLLHDEGMTIKGVQKILREQGVPHVAAMAPPLPEIRADIPEPGAQGAEVLSFERRGTAEPEPEPDTGAEPEPETGPDASAPESSVPQPPDATAAEPPAEAAPATPALAPLPDLPDDPPDTAPAAAGALSALAGLRAPLPADLATRLSGLSARLRSHGADGPADDAPNDATGH